MIGLHERIRFMTTKTVHEYPDDRMASQVALFIADKYKINSDSLHETYIHEFENRFLKYNLQIEKLTVSEYNAFLERLSKRLPIIVFTIISGIDKEMLFFRYKYFFLPIFIKEDSIKVLNAIFRESSEKFTLFIKELIDLPINLKILYANACTNEYQTAKKYHEALETLLLLSVKYRDFAQLGTPFVYMDPKKDLDGEKYEIPENKMSIDQHLNFIETLEDYYLELDRKLPKIKELSPTLSKEEETIKKRTNKKAKISSFWARYIKDLFQQIYGKPHLKEISVFINDLFDTSYTEYDISNLTRQNM